MIIQIVSDLHLDFYGDRALLFLRQIQTKADYTPLTLQSICAASV
jgi:hypothetical protein